MTRMADVARLAGVSPSTVSRVLNGTARVDEATRQTVREAVETLGYRPNAMARSLAARSSSTVGLVVSRFGSPYYGRILDGAEWALAELGFIAVAESSRESAEGERAAWESLRDRQCDAVVIHSDHLSDAELSDRMARHPRAVVINRTVPSHEARCVRIDDRRAGALAARHLLEMGHRRIALVAGPSVYPTVRARSAGFAEALAAAGHPLDPALHLEGDFLAPSGHDAMRALLEGPRPTAVFLQNDEMAAGALDACRGLDVAVPGDVSVVGFDDIALAEHLVPKLTTIAQPMMEIGATAARLAHALARGRAAEEIDLPRVPDAQLMRRESVAPPREGGARTGPEARTNPKGGDPT